jgi:uncharacterized protein YndB with AHSA1/START domain
MRLLKGIAYVFIAIFVIGAALAFFLPASATVERSIEIEAAPEAIFPYLNAPRRFNEWSPWARLDPRTRYSFEGPQAGVGALMRWESEDPGVGSGALQIVESDPPRSLRTALDFGSQGVAGAAYTLAPVAAGRTRVTWTFEIEFGYDLLGRYFGLLMDTWIGPLYEQGLINLRQVVEQGAS